MPFDSKSTVTYKVYSLDVWGDDGDWTVNDRRRAGSVSVRTDRQNKAGWDVSNAALKRALVSGSYLEPRARLDIDGEDDGVLFVDDAKDGYPLLQLEFEKVHEEPAKGFFGEPAAEGESPERRSRKSQSKARSGALENSKENPTEGSKNALGLSTGATVALVAAGTIVVGGIGYWLYQRSQNAAQTQAGTLPAQPAATPALPPITGTTDQIPPFVPTDVSTPIDNA
jgi:hypothetical protein